MKQMENKLVLEIGMHYFFNDMINIRNFDPNKSR